MPRGRRRRVHRIRPLDSNLSTTTARGSRKRTVHKRSRASASAKIDPEKLLESIVDDVSARLGLDVLGLSREQVIEALKPIVEGILEQYSSRPSRDAIISRLVATSRHVYMYVSAYILERFDKLTPEQLEFIASYGEGVAARHMARLYREAIRLGRTDLIPQLRVLWEKYGSPTYISCPYCGFRAITPDLVCMICGREVSESDIKKAIDFPEKLKEFVELYSPRDVEEAIIRGYVVIADSVKPPTSVLSNGEIVLHLTKDERDFLKRLLAERRKIEGHANND